jgi:hypothetical protein
MWAGGPAALMRLAASPPWAAVRRFGLGAPKSDWMRGKRESSCRHVTDVGELPYSQLRRATNRCADARYPSSTCYAVNPNGRLVPVQLDSVGPGSNDSGQVGLREESQL